MDNGQCARQATIKAFDEAVLLRLAGRDLRPLDPGVLPPGKDGVTGQFSAIGRDYCRADFISETPSAAAASRLHDALKGETADLDICRRKNLSQVTGSVFMCANEMIQHGLVQGDTKANSGFSRMAPGDCPFDRY